MDTEETDILFAMYIQSLNARERKAYEIAKSHLGMSFDLEKSNGYLEWLRRTIDIDIKPKAP
jgi:hypothetical protein